MKRDNACEGGKREPLAQMRVKHNTLASYELLRDLLLSSLKELSRKRPRVRVPSSPPVPWL